MQQFITAKLKLIATPEQGEALRQTNWRIGMGSMR
jgi:hypothetical protein